MKVSWESDESHVLINPRAPKYILDQVLSIREKLSQYKGHIWIASSGTTSSNPNHIKLIGLSKRAFLESARSVNRHIQSNQKDICLHALPDFHVGGLSVWARAFISGAKVIPCYSPEKKWDPKKYYLDIVESKASLLSFVPAQLYDMVTHHFKAPKTLRCVFVGGGFLSADLYLKARQLNWNILPTYGCSECCSQVATAELSSLDNFDYPQLKILSHLKVKCNQENRFMFSGKSLLTTYAYLKGEKISIDNPVKEGWCLSDDVGKVKQDFLEFYHRVDDQVKVSGELVNLRQLQSILKECLKSQVSSCDGAVLALPDVRKGRHIVLLLTRSVIDWQKVQSEFNQKVLPIARAQKVYFSDWIPRTPLGKLKINEALQLVLEQKN